MGAVGKIAAGLALVAAGGAIDFYTGGTGGNFLIASGVGLTAGGIMEEFQPQIRRPGSGRGPENAVDSTVWPELVLYGRALVPRQTIFRNHHRDAVSGPDREFSDHVCFVTRGRECDGLEAVLLGPDLCDLVPNNGQVDWFPDDYLIPAGTKYERLFACSFKPGAPDDPSPAFPYLSTRVPRWGPDRKLTHICAIHCIYKFDEKVWLSSPPDTWFLMRGFKVFDPRTDDTVWSANAALCNADCYTGRHGPYGGIDYSFLDEPVLIASANICDEQLVKADGDTVNRYECHYCGDATADFDLLENAIRGSMGGVRVRSGAAIALHAAAPATLDLAFDEGDLAGGVRLGSETPLADLKNQVHTLYCDIRNNYKNNQTPAWPKEGGINPWLAEDGGRVAVQELRLPAVVFTEQAQRIQRIWIERHRRRRNFSAAMKQRGLLLRPMGGFTLDDPLPGWTAKEFLALAVGEGADGRIAVRAQEYSAAIHAWSAGDEQQEVVAQTPAVELADDEVATQQDTAVDVDPLANDPGPGPLTLGAIGSPAHGTAAPSDTLGLITYTPAAGYTGPDEFTYQASNDDGTGTATVFVTVVSNTAVTAVDDSITVSDNGVQVLDPLRNDFPIGGSKSISSITTPSHGSASIIDSGAHVQYQRVAGYIGPDTLDYVVTDGVTSDTGTVTIDNTSGQGGGGGWGKWQKKGQNSGLTWQSGAGDPAPQGGNDYTGAGSWAGRLHSNFPTQTKIDIWTSFMVHDTVSNVNSRIASKQSHIQDLSADNIRVCQTFPLITQEDVGSIAAILSGSGARYVANRAMWRAFAQVFVDAGALSPVFRMGHEMNGGHYPWGQITPAQYIALYRMARAEILDVNPDIVTCWNPLRGAKKSVWWPGDSYVHIVGVDWYNNGGVAGTSNGYVDTQADWDGQNTKGTAAEPIGWQSWIDFCDDHGKMLCVPEWGEGHGSGNGPGPEEDCPGYVALFMTFCAAQRAAGKFMFETYFNNASHQIDPSAAYVPNFRTRYFDNWSGKAHA